MTLQSHDTGDRRGGPFDRRVADLEAKYSTIIRRLDTIDETLEGLTTLKDQITGVLNFLRYVGWGGIVTIALFILRYIVKDVGGH